jgi:hypothetical protein
LTAPADANSITTYSLTNTNAAGSSPLTQILAEISPIGAFDTASKSTPLVAMTGDAQNGLTASFGSGTIPAGTPGAGQPLQVLQLDVSGAGLQPGGTIQFALRLAQGYQGGPPLLSPVTTGVVIPPGVISTPADNSTPAPTPTVTPTSPGSQPTAINTPEPLSLLVWSALAGLGWARARTLRRGKIRMANF